MTMKNSDIAHKIFNKYSDDFIQTMEIFRFRYLDEKGNIIDFENMYVCPLSLRAYHKKDMQKLTIEHVPQNSLKGKPLVLTDKEYNNSDGYTKDKKIFNFFKYQNFQRGVEPIEAKFSVPDILEGKVSGKLVGRIDGEGAKIKIGLPERTVKLLESRGVFRNWDGLKMNFKINYTHQINKSALLKSAYLIAFSKIGYRLLFSKNGLKNATYGAIIHELQKIDIDEDFPFVFTNALKVNIPDEIGIIETEDIKLLAVKVRYRLTGQEYVYHAILPHPEDESLDNLVKFRDIYVKREIEITVKSINRDYLLK